MGNFISDFIDYAQETFDGVKHMIVQATQSESQQTALDEARKAFESFGMTAIKPTPTPVAGFGGDPKDGFVTTSVKDKEYPMDHVLYWLNSSYANTAVTSAHGGFVSLAGLGYWYGIDGIIDLAKDLGI